MSESTANVHRSDAEIFADARRALDQNPRVPEGVHVHVANGVATLTGDVRWPHERREAEQAVTSIRGITRVSNQIVVWSLINPWKGEPPPEANR